MGAPDLFRRKSSGNASLSKSSLRRIMGRRMSQAKRSPSLREEGTQGILRTKKSQLLKKKKKKKGMNPLWGAE